MAAGVEARDGEGSGGEEEAKEDDERCRQERGAEALQREEAAGGESAQERVGGEAGACAGVGVFVVGNSGGGVEEWSS